MATDFEPATSTPTATPIATITATPTPTVSSSPVAILDTTTIYTNSIGTVHFVGEVQNNSPYYLTLVKLTVDLFGPSGQFLGSDYTYVDLDNLEPQTKTCFDLYFFGAPSGWMSYRFQTPGYHTDGKSNPRLAIAADGGAYKASTGQYQVVGQVRNEHGSPLRFVKVIATLYDASGKVLACDSAYANNSGLDVGQPSSFTVTSLGSGRDLSKVTSYRLQADAMPQ